MKLSQLSVQTKRLQSIKATRKTPGLTNKRT